jgi:hypothetical protein
MVLFLALGCSSWFPGVLDAEVDDAWDNSWRGSFTAWLYLAANPSHMGVNVDGLAYPLHHPTVHSYHTRGHGLLLGIVLFCHCSGRCRLLGYVNPPGLRYLVES